MDTSSPRIVGVDFDNTLVLYDRLFENLAVERGLLPDCRQRSKRETRDAVRLLPGGEIEWQKLQAAAYGPRIGEACLAEGVLEFLRCCREQSAAVYVISHKTERAGYDSSGTDLRRAALGWMQAHGLFERIAPAAVFFLPTREEKIACLQTLGCTHFIDDLEETFLEPTFPSGLEKILFAPRPPASPPPGVKVARSWKQICEYTFHAPC